jgi:hypothetical protein
VGPATAHLSLAAFAAPIFLRFVLLMLLNVLLPDHLIGSAADRILGRRIGRLVLVAPTQPAWLFHASLLSAPLAVLPHFIAAS